MTRDPERIKRILGKIQMHWEKYPDQRLWQILFNANHYLYHEETMMVEDPYNIEDEELESKLDNYFNEGEE
jgi:hypothetical protein